MFSPYRIDGTDLLTDRLVLRRWTADEARAVLDGARRSHWAADFPTEGEGVIAGLIVEQLGSDGQFGSGEPTGLLAEYGHRQIAERDSGQLVGSIGLFWPPEDGAVEFGYGIVESRRGQGYATEAARAMVAFALMAPGVHTVCAGADHANPASVRVLEKAGLEQWSSDGTTARFGVRSRARERELAQTREHPPTRP